MKTRRAQLLKSLVGQKEVFVKGVVILMILSMSFSTALAATVTYSGSTNADTTFDRIAIYGASGLEVPYESQPFYVDTAGLYTLYSYDQTGDGMIFLYEDSFDPDDPVANILTLNDDYTNYTDSRIEDYQLEADTQYYLVTGQFQTDYTIEYINDVTGPGTAYLEELSVGGEIIDDFNITLVGINEELGGITEDISCNNEGIATNAVDIAVNTAGIAINSAGIATNTAGIATNTAGIAINTAGIAINSAGIAINSAGLSEIFTPEQTQLLYTSPDTGVAHGVIIDADSTTISGGTSSTTVIIDDDGVKFVDTTNGETFRVENDGKTFVSNTLSVAGDVNVAGKVTMNGVDAASVDDVAAEATARANADAAEATARANADAAEATNRINDDMALRNDFEAANRSVRNDIDDLDDRLDEVGAISAAFSALTPTRAGSKTELSLGLGHYEGQSALAAGLYHHFNNKIVINVGVSTAFESSAAARAGITFGF